MNARLFRLGEAGVLMRDRLTVYIDPIGLPDGLPKADLILLTHSHESHCSSSDVLKVSTPQTIVAGAKDSVSRFRLNQLPMAPGDTHSILGLRVDAVPAYNPKEDTVHPQRHRWLGFVVHAEGGRVYHPGDTAWVPELAGVRAELLLWNAAGRDSMLAADAPACLASVGPRIVCPIHFDPGAEPASLKEVEAACAAAGVAFERLPSPAAGVSA